MIRGQPTSRWWPKTSSVKFRIDGIEILFIHPGLCDFQCFPEALEVCDFALTKELDGIANIGIVYQTENVVICGTCFLLCCKHPSTTIVVKTHNEILLSVCFMHIFVIFRNSSEFRWERLLSPEFSCRPTHNQSVFPPFHG